MGLPNAPPFLWVIRSRVAGEFNRLLRFFSCARVSESRQSAAHVDDRMPHCLTAFWP